MGVNYNTTATNRGLLLSCDFANLQNYSKTTENLFLHSEDFTQASWSKFNTNPTLVNEVGPFPSSSVYQVTNTISQLSYVGQNVVLTNSTTYTVSLYVKPVYGIKVVAYEIFGVGIPTFNLDTLLTSGVGTNIIQTLSNGWYRISSTFTTPASGICSFNVFYFTAYGSTTTQSMFLISGAQFEKSSSLGEYVKTTSSAVVSNSITDKISGLTGTLNGNPYYYYDSSTRSIKFDRDSTIITGGFAQFTGTSNLTASNFFYNDHTMEIFARINDYSGSNINANEGSNALFVYQGYHAGFLYDSATGLYYGLWGANPIVAPSWVYPSRPVAGTWFHAVATRSGTTTTIYLNGEPVSSSSYVINGNPGVSNLIKIGAGNPGTGPYAAYTKMNASIARLYNTALTASEVKQNFNAFRGRGGV